MTLVNKLLFAFERLLVVPSPSPLLLANDDDMARGTDTRDAAAADLAGAVREKSENTPLNTRH